MNVAPAVASLAKVNPLAAYGGGIATLFSTHPADRGAGGTFARARGVGVWSGGWCSIVADREAMKHCLLHHSAVAQVFDDESVQQCRCDVGVPDAFGIHHDDRPSGADAQARRLTTLDSTGPEEQVFSLEELREQAVERAAATLRRAKSPVQTRTWRRYGSMRG